MRNPHSDPHPSFETDARASSAEALAPERRSTDGTEGRPACPQEPSRARSTTPEARAPSRGPSGKRTATAGAEESIAGAARGLSEPGRGGPPPAPGESPAPQSSPTAWDLMQPAGLGGPITKPEVPTPTVLRGRPVPAAPLEPPRKTARLAPTFDFPEDPELAVVGAKPLVVEATWSTYAIREVDDEPAPKADPGRDERLRLARQAEADGRFQDAALILEAAIEAEPRPELLRWLARIYADRLGYTRLSTERRQAADRLERRLRRKSARRSLRGRLVVALLVALAALAAGLFLFP